jgi:hypothetical protein
MAEQQAAFAPRRSTDPEIAAAIDLGWRMAELFGLDPAELTRAAPDNLLPGRNSLPPAERLVLELRAAAGDAERAKVPIAEQALAELLHLAAEAPNRRAAEQELRERLRNWHVSLDTDLWAQQEAKGRAYELGNFLSDTWNRAVCALRAHDGPALGRELRAVFSPERVERIRVLLDELEARLDPAAVRIVKRHLESWRDRVGDVVPEDGASLPFEPTQSALDPLRSQTLTWRQLVSGDKEPEAYLDREHRAKVRDVMVKRIAQSYRRHVGVWIAAGIVVALVVGVVVGLTGPLGDWYHGHKALVGAIVAFAGSVTAALGVSSASVAATVRRSLDARAELMWNTALAEVICQQTLFVDRLLPQPEASGAERLGVHLRREARKAARKLEPGPPPRPQH